MSFEKENFLRTKLIRYLQQLDPATPALWGKMSAQQMVEHLSGDALRVANGKLIVKDMYAAPDITRRMYEFMMSDKPFRENTRNPLLPIEARALHFKTMQGAIGALHQELIHFFELFEKEAGTRTRNPLFGDLNFEENVQLLHKHALHHLRQFGVIPLDI